MEKKLALELIDFLYDSPSACHGVKATQKILDENGFIEIKEADKWDLQAKGKYYVIKNDSALIAFEVGTGDIEETGFRLIGAHTDVPGFRIKPNPQMISEGKYVKLNTEVYGGPILHTWFDRPLSIAGKVSLKGESPLKPETRLVNINKPMMIIPNIAIHMNREVNKGVELKVQTDLEPIVSLIGAKENTQGWLLGKIAAELGIEADSILDYELFLCNGEEPSITGFDDEFLSAPRLDNLTSCQSCLNAIMDTEALSDICNLVVLFDNEECGSSSKQGAGSVILSSILEKIYLNTPDTDKSRTAFIDVMLHSLTASLDVAHAMHPNHPEKNDPTNPIPMEGGVVIKMNYNQRYATDTNAVSIVEGICRAEKIAHTKFVNHGDAVGGGTLGSILSTSIPAMTVDLGVPILAMHSSRELMARSSQLAMDQFAEAFFK